ncbi:MAG: T9SS C-terminal target domain-containing protein, partial [Ignavibacteria bacterium]
PNPFNPTTQIKFSIPKAGDSPGISKVKLIVYDALGRIVKTLLNSELAPGIYTVEFDAHDLNSGIYFYEINYAGKRISKKMAIIK